jgi:hypothetical protein
VAVRWHPPFQFSAAGSVARPDRSGRLAGVVTLLGLLVRRRIWRLRRETVNSLIHELTVAGHRSRGGLWTSRARRLPRAQSAAGRERTGRPRVLRTTSMTSSV